MNYRPTQLSAEAFEELRTIIKTEIEEVMTDDAIEEMGVRLLRLFSVLSVRVPQSTPIEISDQESKALTFLRGEIQDGRNPSIRALCKVVGFRSSRSGFRLLNRCIANGWVARDAKGVLRVIAREESNSSAARV